MTYRDFVQSRINPDVPRDSYLTNAAMGLAGEAGEFVDALKKHLFHGHPIDATKLIKELGDILFYAEMAAIALNVDTEEVIQRNVDKLSARYPNGFETTRSLKRAIEDK